MGKVPIIREAHHGKKERKRTYRTTEQRAADLDPKISELTQTIAKYEGLKSDLDAKIKKVKSRIALLEQKKASLYKPRTRKPRKSKSQKIKDLLQKASKDGLKPEEIAKRLGFDMESD